MSTPMFSSLTDFKRRILKGTKVKCVWSKHHKDGPTLAPVGVVTEVYEANTVGLTILIPGRAQLNYDEWPRRSEILFTPNGWAWVDKSGQPTLVYEVVEWADGSKP